MTAMKSKFTIEQIQSDIDSLGELSLKELEKIQLKYKSEISIAKTGKEEKFYVYPFAMYFGHEYRDVSHIFKEGEEYTEKQITAALISHGYKEFKMSNEIECEFFKDENCLFPKFKLGNRG